MSVRRRSSALSAAEMRVAALGPWRASMAERPNEKEDQERKLREEYERLLRQLDRKPADSPQPSDISPAKPENSAPRRS
jgi:hypothetical protein